MSDILGVNSRQGSGLPHFVSEPFGWPLTSMATATVPFVPNTCTQYLAYNQPCAADDVGAAMLGALTFLPCIVLHGPL